MPVEGVLDHARRHVSESAMRLIRQRLIIGRLLETGDDVIAPMRLLSVMQQTHEAAEKHLTFQEAQYTASRNST